MTTQTRAISAPSPSDGNGSHAPAAPESGIARDECPNCGARHRGNARFCSRCGYSFTGAAPKRFNIRGQQVSANAGQVLNGRYRIIKPIARGAMGAVHLAHDDVLKRYVVVKTLLTSDDPELVAQSVQEREFLATLKHPNIVGIYDFFTVGPDGFIVMEYVKGRTLYEMIEEQGAPVGIPAMIRYTLGILPAFSYLARLGLIYCDFKPENLMIEELGDGGTSVKLIDLGTVIKWTPDPEVVYGTEGFYAPEAVQAPSPATDLYTICRTLAWAISWMDMDNPQFGMPPAEQYPAFRDHPMLYRLLVKGTHDNPARRFHNAAELGDQLEGVLRMIVGGTPGTAVVSRFFMPRAVTPRGNPGRRGETALDGDDPAIALLQQGDLALRSDNLVKAFDYFNQAIAVNPASVDAQVRTTEVLIERGEFSPALAAVTRARRLAPNSWKVAWYNGHLLEASAHLSAASEQYLKLLDDLPGELPPLAALARVCAKQGNHAAAAQLYRAVLRADPDDTDAIFGLVQALLDQCCWEETAQVLHSVPEMSSRYVDAQLALCDLYLNRMEPLTPDNLARAAEAITAVQGRTDDPRYYLARGDVFRAACQFAHEGKLPADTPLTGVPDKEERTLGEAAEASYVEYLRREPNRPSREDVVRRRFQVAPWRVT